MQDAERLFLFLPEEDDGPIAWARGADGRLTEAGPDWSAEGDVAQPVVAVAPPGAVGLATLDLPALSPAQASAAARLALADRLGSSEGLHIAAAAGDGPRLAAWLDQERMRSWLSRLAEAGAEPVAMIPAGALIRPEGDALVRYRAGPYALAAGQGTAWADDPVLTAAMGSAEPVEIGEDAVVSALFSAADDPQINLLSGPFARKRRWALTAPEWKLVGWLALALVAVTLLVPVAQAWSVHRSAARLEAGAAQLAAKAFPGTPDPLAALAQKGAGRGAFLRVYALVAETLSAFPGSQLSSLTLRPDGGFDLDLRAADMPTLRRIYDGLAAKGLSVTVAAETPQQGQAAARLTVTG